jgi:hypothetical protein
MRSSRTRPFVIQHGDQRGIDGRQLPSRYPDGGVVPDSSSGPCLSDRPLQLRLRIGRKGPLPRLPECLPEYIFLLKPSHGQSSPVCFNEDSFRRQDAHERWQRIDHTPQVPSVGLDSLFTNVYEQ